jgi:hypothetical protein
MEVDSEETSYKEQHAQAKAEYSIHIEKDTCTR